MNIVKRRDKLKKRIIVFILFLLFLGGCTSDNLVLDNKVTGIVVNSQKIPLENAEVKIKGLNKTVKTDDNGFFKFEDVKQDKHTLVINKKGFQTKSLQFAIDTPLDIVNLDFIILND